VKLPHLHHSTRSGSALVSTLLVIAVLTIIVVAFLQSMGIERKTAHSYLTRYQAELAANAAADYAKNLIYRTISDEASKVNDPTITTARSISSHGPIRPMQELSRRFTREFFRTRSPARRIPPSIKSQA